MGSRSTRVVKNAGINLLNNGIRFISRTALSIVTARVLGPKNLGVLSLVGSFASLGSLFVNLGIAFGVTKYVAELEGKKDRENIGAFINFALMMKTSAACLVVFALVVLSGHIAGFFNIPAEQNLFILAFLSLIPGGISGIFSSALAGVQQYHYSLKIHLVSDPISFAASVIVLLQGYGVSGLLLVGLVMSILRMMANVAAARFEGLLNKKFKIPAELRKRAIRFNMGVTTMMVLDEVVWKRSEVYFLGKFRPIQEAGFYSLAYSFTTMTVTFVSSAISSVLVPIQSQAFGEKNTDRMKKIYHKSVKYLAVASFPIAAGGIALAEPLIKIVYGSQYLPVVGIACLLFISSAGARVGSGFASLMYSAELVAVKVRFGIGYAILNILLDFLLIPKYGIWGAAIANSGTQLLGLLIGPFVIYHFFKFEFPAMAVSRVILAAGFMGGGVYTIWGLLGIQNIAALLATMLVGVVLYGIGLLIFGAIDQEDVRLIKDVYEKLPPKFKGRYISLLSRLENYVK